MLTEDTHLDTVRPDLDLTPADGLVRPRARIAAVEFLPCVDVDSAFGPVAHQAGVGDMVLDHPAAQDDHARPRGPYCQRVDPAHIVDDIDPQPAR